MPTEKPDTDRPDRRRHRNKLLLLLLLITCVAAYFALGLDRTFSLARAQALQGELQALYAERPVTVAALFALCFIAGFALALPVGSVLSLAGGAIFGFWLGVLLVSFASTIGATLAFLGGRYLFADAVRRRFARQLAVIDAGIAREGGRYLFTLRLVPAFPPGLLSVLFGLTKMDTARFYVVSQLGMLTGTLIYVNAGTQLAGLRSLGDILSPGVLVALCLLAGAPWALRGLLSAWRSS